MKRTRADYSGSSAANQLDAGPASPQQPGVRRPAVFPLEAAPEALRRLGGAPRPAGGAAPGPSGNSGQVRLRTAPANLRGVPEIAHRTTAPGMGPQDQAMPACAQCNSQWESPISAAALARGRNVQDLEQLKRVLQEVQSLPAEPPHLRAQALAVLAGRIGALKDDRVPAFDAILATILQAPGQDRRAMDTPLMMLAAQVATLPLEPAEQAGALQQLLQAQEPSGSLAGGLHLLAGRLEDLPQAARQQAPTQVRDWAERLAPGPARELIEHLQDLPGAAQGPAFSGLLQACGSMAPRPRGARLVDLARSCGWLAAPVHVQAVRHVLAATESRAPEQRLAVLKLLGEGLDRLPDAERASTWQALLHSYLTVPAEQATAALAQLHEQVRTLRSAGSGRQLAAPSMPGLVPAVETWSQQGGGASPEANQLVSLLILQGLCDQPEAVRQGSFTQVLQSIPKLLEAHRGQVLSELVKAIAILPQAGRVPAWQGSLTLVQQSIPQLQEAHRGQLLSELAKAIAILPQAGRLPAWQATLKAVEPLALQQRWAVLPLLAQAVCLLPSNGHTSAWREVVQSYLAVPPAQQAETFAKLHDQIKTLRQAEPEQRLWMPLMPEVVDEVRALPQRGVFLTPEGRRAALLMCAQEVRNLPPTELPDIFRQALHHSIPQLRQEHRGPMLMEWARAIPALLVKARQPEWQDILWAAKQLPPQQGVAVFAALAAQIGALPMKVRAAAFESLLEAHRGLQEQFRVLTVNVLGQASLAQPRAEWPSFLERVLGESEQIPELERRAKALLGLARKFCLAGPAANGPFEPAQPDRPRLDVRVRCLEMIMASLPAQAPPPEQHVAFVNGMDAELERRLQQQQDDAAVLTELLAGVRRLRGA